MRHAPVVVLVPGGYASVFPRTNAAARACGEFVKRIEPAPTHRAPGEQ